MIRTLLGCALAAGIATPAMAQSTDTGQRQLLIAGLSPSACVFGSNGGSSNGGVNATYLGTGRNAGQINIVQMVDPRTAQPRQTAITIALPLICNSAHSLTITSVNGGLTRLGANQRNQPVGSFAEFQPYTMRVDWIGQSVSRPSNAGSPLVLTASNAGAGQIGFGFAVPASTTPLVAGTYSDSIVIAFRAAN